MRILFITSNRIGDAVLSTCLLRHLTDQNPDARITVACGPVPAPLFGAVRGLERVWLLRKSRMANIKLSTHWFKLWGKAVGTRWDMVIDLRRSWLFYFLWYIQICYYPFFTHYIKILYYIFIFVKF